MRMRVVSQELVDKRRSIFKKYRKSLKLYRLTGTTILSMCRKVVNTVSGRERRRRDQENRRMVRQREIDSQLRQVIREIQEILGERLGGKRRVEIDGEDTIRVTIERESLEEESLEEEEALMEERETVETIDAIMETQKRTLGELQVLEDNMRRLVGILCEEGEQQHSGIWGIGAVDPWI